MKCYSQVSIVIIVEVRNLSDSKLDRFKFLEEEVERIWRLEEIKN